jgi:predicted DCC family thiol-disulfide oxidoreductase YuxK
MEHPVVLFDGVCNLCNGSVNFIIDRDPKATLRFASLQSSAARELLEKHGMKLPEGDPDSILLVTEDRVYDRSGAALRIAGKLRSPIAVLWIFLIVPWFIRDFFYKIIARNRYKWFGKSDACRVPTPELKERFVG